MARSHEKLPLKCESCGETFWWPKNWILCAKAGETSSHRGTPRGSYCSSKCWGEQRTLQGRSELACEECGNKFTKVLAEIKKTKHHFCSKRCAAIYHNARKIVGTRRSKLEVWLESELRRRAPEHLLQCNTRPFGLELDLYFPDLKLAVEVNGIFHYKPIHGTEKLSRLQTLDAEKIAVCQRLGVFLLVLDSSAMVHFTVETALPYLVRVLDEIDGRARKGSNLQPWG